MIRIVLPAYNEADSLVKLLPQLTESLKRERLSYIVYVVDDGSSDATAKVVKKYALVDKRVRLIKHLTNMGLAEAINSGFKEALKNSHESDVLITMDADNTHLPGLIMRMVRLVFEGHDIVISSRFVSGSRVKGVPLDRLFLSKAGSIVFRLLFPIKGVKDYTSGYRSYRVGIIKQASEFYKSGFISEEGFTCMVDILLKLRRFDPLCSEVPMILRYDQKIGKSKMNVPLTIEQSLNLIGRYVKKSVINVFFSE